jgi:transposase InsO family protein
MPWEVTIVTELRTAFVNQVVARKQPVSEACRQFGISRKTGYKWLARYRKDAAVPLVNQSRRPRRSPRQTADELEQRVLATRGKFHWGARKIRAYLVREGVAVPSVRTVNQILNRHGQITPPLPETPEATTRFERSAPHELWQCDHKGPLEVERQPVYPLTVLDDHSRYLLALRPCTDLTMKTAFAALWDVFGEYGLPENILCDNAFGSAHSGPKTVSWFESQLIRLGIHPTHGRPYHPQTQGKVERIHGTFETELWPYIRRDTIDHFHADATAWRCQIYNLVRPHEALGDQPPITRFRVNPRKRPDQVPEVVYPADAIVRKTANGGDVSWRGYRILVGGGLVGQDVRIEDHSHEVHLYFAWKCIRVIPSSQLTRDKMV